jgi:alpha-galactosidase
VEGTTFALNGDNVSYRFHVDEATGDLISDHFGGPVMESVPMLKPNVAGWVGLPGRVQREFPDAGRGDFRVPAVRIRQSQGYTVTDFRYKSHTVVEGKPALAGLPSTFGNQDDVTTLVVHMYDNYSSIAADLTYSIFPKLDAIVRSVNVTNQGQNNITIEKLASFSVDLPYGDYDMIELRGDWAREAMKVRRKVEYGTQGYVNT